MDDLKVLQERLSVAVRRIEGAIPAAGSIDSALEQENAALRERLAQLEAHRQSDRRELDALLARVQELLEGGDDA